jgi:hypothetical protein
MIDVRSLNKNKWAVVDLDTGTVLGTNVVLVPYSDSMESASDSEVIGYAEENTIPLAVDRGAEMF